MFTALNERVRIDATVLDQDSKVIPDATVNWRSTNRDVATVTDRGVVTATGSGTTQIIVTSGYATASATVTVEQAEDSIEIMPASLRLTRVGETGQFTALVYDSAKRIIPAAVVGWTSGHPAIATVDANGLVTAVSAGTAQITASSGAVSTFRPVYVEIARVPSRIVLNVSEATLSAVGQSLQLDAQVYDAEGAAIPGAQVTWASSRTDVATVSADGLVIAVSNGTTRVTASSEGASAHATIHVVIEGTEPPPPPPEPPPPPPEPPPEPPPPEPEPPPEPPPPPEPEPSSDRDILIEFYHATDGPNWTNNTNWLSEKPIRDWFGVLGTDLDGRVTWLELVENGLTGPFPPVLGKLDRLNVLYLHYNNLTGPVPREIGNLRNLIYLYFGGNDLTGPIPPELGQLVKLEDLDISDSGLTGSIPPEIGKLRKLGLLGLQGNQLSGQIPPEIGMLSNLRSLGLGQNELSGPIPPEIGQLSSLQDLNLFENRLSGSIPPEIGKLDALEGLGLQSNQLTGAIPPEIGNLNSLYGLSLSNNELEGNIPPEIGNLNNLGSITLSNNQLEGNIPPEFGRLTRLKSLSVEHNAKLAGPIPRELIRIPLEDISLHGTQLCVPSDDAFTAWLAGIGTKFGIKPCEDEPEESADRDALVALYNATDGPNWTNNTNWLSDRPLGEWHGVTTDDGKMVIELYVVNNNLTGTLPAEIGRLRNISRFDLSGNRISGPIPPEIGQLRSLERLYMPHNQLTGEIPPEIGQLVNLTSLAFAHNQLSGVIPPELGKLQSLLNIWLSDNRFSGGIPPELGSLNSLRSLQIHRNQLTGDIPHELWNLKSLRKLLIYDNEFTGEIASEIGELKALQTLWLSGNHFTGGNTA